MKTHLFLTIILFGVLASSPAGHLAACSRSPALIMGDVTYQPEWVSLEDALTTANERQSGMVIVYQRDERSRLGWSKDIADLSKSTVFVAISPSERDAAENMFGFKPDSSTVIIADSYGNPLAQESGPVVMSRIVALTKHISDISAQLEQKLSASVKRAIEHRERGNIRRAIELNLQVTQYNHYAPVAAAQASIDQLVEEGRYQVRDALGLEDMQARKKLGALMRTYRGTALETEIDTALQSQALAAPSE